MIIQPPGSDLSDPFLAAVRRRHPDVDIVLLPPEPPPADDEPAAPADTEAALAALAASHDRVTAIAETLWGRLAGEDADPPPVTFRPAVDGEGVRVVAEGAVRLDADTAELLDGLSAALTDDGWRVDRPGTGLPRLVAHRDGLRAMVSYAATGVARLTVDGPEQQVGREAAAELVRVVDGRHRP